MGSSQALAIERLLTEVVAKKKDGVLLAGPGSLLRRASELAPPGASSAMPTSVAVLDGLLPGGLPKGRLVELSGRRSSGRFSLGLAALAAATSSGLAAALVDLGDHLDPQTAEPAGVDLRRLLWARPRRAKEALAAAEMLLAAGFPLVVADLGLSPRTRWVPDAAWVRLARSAAAQDATLLLTTPWRASGIAADAVVSAGGACAIWQGSGRTPRLLAGLTSRLTLEKYGRSTPGVSGRLSLAAGEAIEGVSGDHPFPGVGAGLVPAHMDPRIVAADAGGREGRPYTDSDSDHACENVRESALIRGARQVRRYPNSDHGACPGSFSMIRSSPARCPVSPAVSFRSFRSRRVCGASRT